MHLAKILFTANMIPTNTNGGSVLPNSQLESQKRVFTIPRNRRFTTVFGVPERLYEMAWLKREVVREREGLGELGRFGNNPRYDDRYGRVCQVNLRYNVGRQLVRATFGDDRRRCIPSSRRPLESTALLCEDTSPLSSTERP